MASGFSTIRQKVPEGLLQLIKTEVVIQVLHELMGFCTTAASSSEWDSEILKGAVATLAKVTVLLSSRVFEEINLEK